MKKSEKIKLAMLAVVECESMDATDKLELIEFLMGEKSMAEWIEEDKAKRATENEEN